MLSGWEAHIPADIAFGAPRDDDERAGILPESVDKQQRHIHEAYDLAQQELNYGCTYHQKKHYDLYTVRDLTLML